MRLIVAGPGWQPLRPAPTDGVTAWGRDPAGWDVGPARLAGSALARELQLLRLRVGPGGPSGRPRAVRLVPPTRRPGAKSAARRWLSTGAVLRWPAAGRTVLADLCDREGLQLDGQEFGAGSGGGVMLRGRGHGGSVLLRASCSGAPADPAEAARALLELNGQGTALVPRLHGAGQVAGVSWSIEQLLGGSRPAALGRQLREDAALFSARLPRRAGEVPLGRLPAVLARVLPDLQPAARRLAESTRAGLAGVPAVTQHGDFWSGNLLERDGRLTGVVDWDSSRAGAAGSDLLHLYATERRRGTSMGALFLRRPWEDEGFAELSAGYWAQLGFRPAAGQLAAIGSYWWAEQSAADLVRAPHLAADDGWVRANLTTPLLR